MLLPARIFRGRSKNQELDSALRCLAALMLVISVGTCGFMLIEGDWGLWKSLFFTLITVTTVGYGDEGLSDSGQVFAAVVLIMGIGTATYSLSSLVQVAINYQTSWKRRMQNQINRLADHLIICGHGRIGQTVAEQLHDASFPFVVIEHSEERVQAAIEKDVLVVQGNSTEDEVLLQAGIDRSRGIICVTDSDAENVFVILSARELKPGLFIAARASTEAAACKMRRAGANVVVSPYVSAGQQIADAMLRRRGSASPCRSDRVELIELQVSHDTRFVGKSISELGKRFPAVIFVAVKSAHHEEVIRPGGDRRLAVDDVVTLAGHHAELKRMHNELERRNGVEGLEVST